MLKIGRTVPLTSNYASELDAVVFLSFPLLFDRTEHDVRTVAINDRGICQFVTRENCVETAERIKVLSEVETPGTQETSPRRWEGDSIRPSPNYFGHLLHCRLIVRRQHGSQSSLVPGQNAGSFACFAAKVRPHSQLRGVVPAVARRRR